ncbi:amino acid ABC transporter permease [Pandoraea terrae]|uniref:Amino acid ABC transporter permease n=1 Tax=Pandoraea terrae TaxID=1537710 RepID=A0A5E4WXZ8_9BURK|nr:amino acid ABC transporter permease [Pandoraea terrae]VVE29233.1 amino acid ABC transporter permease [Pandoraea terrae]
MLDILKDNWEMLLLGQYPNGPLGGLALTLILSVAGLGLSFPFSILIALGRTSPIALFRIPTTVIVYVVRGVPLIMLIFWAYFFVPSIIGRPVTGFTTLLCTLVVYEAAYLGEVIRAGIEALPRGQVEAARALGLSYFKTTLRVVLPQALYNMLPSMVSQFVSTIKETSLGYVISVQELTFSANQVNNNLLTQPFGVFAILALTYFIVCFVLTQFAHRLEKRIHNKRKGASIKRRPVNDLLLQGK